MAGNASNAFRWSTISTWAYRPSVSIGVECLAKPEFTARFQVRTEQFGRIVRNAEHRLCRGFVRQPRLQQVGQVLPHRLDVAPPVLRVAGLNGHRGWIGVQVERPRRQASEFVRPEASAHRNLVQDGAVRPGHAVGCGASFGCPNKPHQFVIGQHPAVVPSVELHVITAQVRQRILTGPAVPPQPACELLDRPQVVVAGLKRSALFTASLRCPHLTNRAKCPLNRRRRDLTNMLRLTERQNVRHAGFDVLDLFDGNGLGLESYTEVGQVAFPQPGLRGSVAGGLSVM